MNNDINLLAQKEGAKTSDSKYVLVARIVAVSTLLIVAFSAVILFVLRLQSPLEKLKAEEEGITKQLLALSGKRLKLVIIKERLQDIADIIKRRPEFDKKIELLETHISSGVTISNLRIDNTKIQFTASSSSLQSIEEFFSALIETTADTQKKVYKRVSYDSLSLSSNSSVYTVNILIETL